MPTLTAALSSLPVESINVLPIGTMDAAGEDTEMCGCGCGHECVCGCECHHCFCECHHCFCECHHCGCGGFCGGGGCGCGCGDGDGD